MTNGDSTNIRATAYNVSLLRRAALPSIILIYTSLAILCWGRLTNLIIDRGFELYLTWRMNNGEMPIKDYYLTVPPGSYQINALLFRCFGDHISVLLAAGAINGLVFIFLWYGILLRVTTQLVAWGVVVSTILVSIFNDSVFNFYFPYTFAMPYASSAFVASLLALLVFTERRNRAALLLASLLYGLSICMKYEFALFGLVLFYAPVAIRFGSRYLLLYCLLCAGTPLVLSLGLLAIGGVGISEWGKFIEWLRVFVSSPSLSAFYKRSGVYSSEPLINHFRTSMVFFLAFGHFLLTWVYLERFKTQHLVKLGLSGLLLILCLYTSWDRTLGFLWLGLISLCTSIVVILYLAKSRRDNPAVAKQLLVLVALVLAGVKSLAAPVVSMYGSIFWPYYWGALGISLSILQARSRSPIIASLSRGMPLILVAISLSVFIRYTLPSLSECNSRLASRLINKDVTLRGSERGLNSFSIPSTHLAEIEPFLNEINFRRRQESRLLVLPEGSMLNFILRLPGSAGFHNLIPTFFYSYGEELITDHIRSDRPHFILLHKAARSEYAPYSSFGVDYATNVASEISTNYCKLNPIDASTVSDGLYSFELWSSHKNDCDTTDGSPSMRVSQHPQR